MNAMPLYAMADCGSNASLRFPTAREGAIGYANDGSTKCLYVCDGMSWVNQCTATSVGGGGGGGGGGGSPVVTPTTTCYEAESQPGTGGTSTATSPAGATLRGAFANPGEYVNFSNISITTAGNYTLEIYFASAEDPTAGIITNGGAVSSFYLGTSYLAGNGTSWTTVSQRNTSTALNSGTNQIRIQGSSGGAFNLDKICVTGPN